MNGAKVEQAIWRAYAITDAKAKYNELRYGGPFQPSQDLLNDPDFVRFAPPAEISFQSKVADEFYMACGWWRWAYCEVIARYRNYVVDLRMDQQAELEGNKSYGLTYAEVETIIKAMDAKFAEALDSLPTPAPE